MYESYRTNSYFYLITCYGHIKKHTSSNNSTYIGLETIYIFANRIAKNIFVSIYVKYSKYSKAT